MTLRSKHDDPVFELQPYSVIDKVLTITGPDNLTLWVDYDDVNHYATECMLPLVIRALNGIDKQELADAARRGEELAENAFLEDEKRIREGS